MKKNVQTIFIIILLISNAILLFILIGKPMQGPPAPERFLVKELHLTEDQQVTFKELEIGHRDSMRQLLDKLGRAKDQFFDFRNSENKDSIVQIIGTLEAQKDRITFEYFKKLRTICTPDQKELFDRIIRKALRGNPPNNQRDNPPPRRKF